MLGCGEQKRRVDTRKFLVYLSNGTFELEVGRRTKSAQDMRCSYHASAVDGKACVRNHFQLVVKQSLDKLHALLDGEITMLIAVHTYSDNYLIEYFKSAAYYTLVSDSERIERAREDCLCHLMVSFSTTNIDKKQNFLYICVYVTTVITTKTSTEDVSGADPADPVIGGSCRST